MLGRAVVILGIVLLAIALPVFPQCAFTPVRSAEFRSTALDLSIDGNNLWVATSYGVSLYDRTVDPPKLVASIAVPGITRVVRAQSGIAFAGSGSSVVVVQKSGAHTLNIAKTIDAGGTINDIAATPFDLYVATSNGIAQVDLLNVTKTNATFATSRSSVTSLALINQFLYAADGDASVEVFDINAPAAIVKAGTLTAPSAVAFVRASNGKIFASSGALATFVFFGTGASMTNIGTATFGTSSVAPLLGDISFMAAADRRLHAVDFTATANPVELFRDDIAPSSGSTNRIGGLATAGNRLYVAAGDIGLVTYDVTAFASPFAIHAYTTASGSSVVSTGDHVFAARDSGGITNFSQSASGILTQGTTWDTSHADAVWDGANGFLLSSTGQSATLWTTIPTTPQVVASTTFRAPVASAVLSGTVGYAVLTDRSLWSVDFGGSSSTPAPKQITLSGINPSAISHSGSAFAIADFRDDGTTNLAYFATGDFSQTPKIVTVPGVSVTGVSLSGTTAAVLTFQGVTIVDFASSSTTVIPQSTGFGRSLILSGTTAYEITDTSLLVWDVQKKQLAKRYTVPADPVALHVAPSSTIADIATGSGVATIATSATTQLPQSVATGNPNEYYKRAVAGASRIDLFDGHNADVFYDTLRFVGSIRGVADIAANDNGVYSISNSFVVSSYNADGYPRGSLTMNLTNSRVLGIHTAGDAVWVSIESDCPACTQTTTVFDPRSGVSQTSTFGGNVLDVVTSGTRAYVLTDQPAEIRVVNIADPFHPSTTVSAPAPQSAIAIAYANGTVYVLGDKLTAYAESTLTLTAEILGSYVPDPTGTIIPTDQKLRIDGTCAVVVGRAFAPQIYTITSPTAWTSGATFPMPSVTRSLAVVPGVMHFLTDHSLETWSTKPLPKPPRREPAR